MGWLKNLLGTGSAPAREAASGPLGLAQGKAIRFDTTLALLLDGSTSVRVPDDRGRSGAPAGSTSVSRTSCIAIT